MQKHRFHYCRGSESGQAKGRSTRSRDQQTNPSRADLQVDVRWFCGSSKERAAWSKPANQLRVFYRSDGTIQWSVYECTDLSGPTKAGEKCAVPENTEFCPKFDGADSNACVFELKKSTSNVNSKTTTISVDGKIRAEVE